MNYSQITASSVLVLILAFGSILADRGKIPLGQETKLEGVIVERNEDSFVIRAHNEKEFMVMFSAETEIEEKKSNPFRRAKQYSAQELLLGLTVEVEGVGNAEGHLVAEEIDFTQDDLKTARTISSRVNPVEDRLNTAESDLAETRSALVDTQANVEELDSAFRVVREETRQAQRTADQAQDTADEALEGVETTNLRIDRLDQYREADLVTLFFGFDTANLSEEGKERLDQMVSGVADQKGYLIEIRGFTSADGNDEYNRRLSEKRAETVLRYLVEKHQIPMRRITAPMGYGEMNPVADNSDLSGRKQNRRVEVRVFVNEALSSSKDFTQ